LADFLARGGEPVIDRRTFAVALIGAFAAPALHAQRARTLLQIGFLRIVAPPRDYIEAFEQGLRDRGHVPGRDVAIDYRFADGRVEQLDRHAKELVDSKVAIIIVAGNQAVRSAMKSTRTVPIVMAVANDPVASGFIKNMARPGGNITGTTLLSSTLAGKRLELLKAVLPEVSRVAVLINKDNPGHSVAWKETLAAASTLRIHVQAVEVDGAASFDKAFARMVQERAEALVLFEDALFVTERVRLVALAARARLPAVYGQRNSVNDGGFLSYGPSIVDAYRSAGNFVDKILKGARPADLPIEQPTKYELVVNMKTAKSLGLTIPQSLLARADEVIE
jgi:putative tryptophan/tyrosine transport system substrate-binding protein